DSPHGLESGPARWPPAPVPGHPRGRVLLLRALVLSGAGGRERSRRGVVRVRPPIRGGHRARSDLGHPVPPREEPALGTPHARKLRRDGLRPGLATTQPGPSGGRPPTDQSGVGGLVTMIVIPA